MVHTLVLDILMGEIFDKITKVEPGEVLVLVTEDHKKILGNPLIQETKT